MNNVITSRSGNKEATIIYTISGGYRATITQVVNTGIGIEKDLFQTKNGFKSHLAATKWALKIMNPTLR